MIHWLPGDARTLHGHHWTLLLVQPGTKSDQFPVGGPTVDQLCGDLAIVTDATETCRQLRRMHIDTATDRVDHLHGASLLHVGGSVAWTPVLPALDALCPRVLLRADLAGCRERDGPFPLRVQCPQFTMSSG